MKILNLYAGIGGNRKLWGDKHEITAVEEREDIAAVYKDYFPNDTIIIADAHQYLLDHYKEFDFIWASCPCQTHSRTNYFLNKMGIIRYPDMKLYQEIIFLKTFFKGAWCVENVKPYYEPLIIPTIELDRHLFWSNFRIEYKNFNSVSIGKMCGNGQTERRKTIEQLTVKKYGFDLTNHNIKGKQQVIRNIVNPEIGLHILNCALNKIEVKQTSLFE